jgi:uncharacterized protein YfaS (alpha-2-macroglobulin family)
MIVFPAIDLPGTNLTFWNSLIYYRTMKHPLRLLAISFYILAAGIIIACSGQKNVSGDSLRRNGEEYDYSVSPAVFADSGLEYATAEEAERAFTLDYRLQHGEPESFAETLSAEDLMQGTASPGTGRSASVIPGLRKLAAYKTSYFDPEKETARKREIEEAQERALLSSRPADAENEALSVIDWGPRGKFSAAVQRPSIYVMFSSPMVPLAGLGKKSDTSPVMSIDPPLKGSFRWYGTSFLSFEGDEPCQSQQQYTITVSANAQSLFGQKISGERIFKFETETLGIKQLIIGEEYRKKTGFYFAENAVPPEAAKEITLVFNYPVRLEDISPYLEIKTAAGGEKNFTLSQEDEGKLKALLTGEVEFATELSITLKAGAKSFNATLGSPRDQVYRFNTPGSFMVSRTERLPSYGKYLNLLEIYFSCPLNRDSVRGHIHTTFKDGRNIPFDEKDNLEIEGRMLRVYNLPVGYGDIFNITIDAETEDMYGRKLTRPYTAEIRVPDEPPPVGEVRFLTWNGSHRMLEAQFKPRFLFEYRNIAPGGWYELGKQDNPFSRAAEPLRFYLKPGEKNYRYFEEIDLSPYLNEQGKGFVFFNADVALLSNQKRKNSEEFVIYQQENETSIQVTDLGITARYGFNKATVLVSKLSTGEPVEGARVRLLSPQDLEAGYAGIPELEDFGNALTDSSGLAVIPLETGLLRNSTMGEYSYEPPYILAEKDGDMAVFDASSHNLWAFGVYASSPQRAEEVKAVTFLFSDRGIYKPGEELSFRGVDRSLVLGMYTIYQGSYTVTLEEDSYDSNTVSAIEGEVSGSGGFYGKIVLPDELRPGSYRLVYRRSNGSGNSNITASHPVQVAFFERLKFQASVSRPEAQVIAGEDISVSLSASYLSGGSLAGSSWESYWYRQSVRYRPEGAAASSYSFGPFNAYDGQRNIDSARGALGADGTAQLKTKTEGQTQTGAPYRYSVEASVTDISGQMISAGQSVIVHPASFYLGLARAGKAGFARKGEEVSFDYIALTPSGEKAGKNLYLASGEDAGKMNLELIREDWNRVQQQGVGGYIYDQYVRDLVTEDSRKLNLEEKGSFRVKPSGAGYYTIRISSRDREGRQIITESSFYVTGSGGGYWDRNNAAELRLIPDRNLYDPGETATVMLQSVIPSGWYLITVEREGIFTEEVRRFTEPVSTFEIPIAANYVPVVYVSISSYSVRGGPPSHNYGSPDLDKPKGYFGVTKVFVNKRIKAFTVKVESDKKSYRPGEEVNITLKAERGGQPLSGAELTLMAVDRGVLDLINYHVPDPINYFYDEERFPLSVRGGDSRSWLMDPVTYNVKNLAGGDEGKLEERKDFNPTAVFEPMLLTGKDGTVRFSFRLPDTLTTYRLTVFGVMGDLFAIRETEIASQNRINVREVLPRRLRERDTAEAGVLISNLDGKAHKISVSLGIAPPRQELNNPSGRIKVPGEAFVDGRNEHTITVQSGENAVVYFDLAAQKEGTVALEFSIKSEILNEKLVNEILIEHPYVRETVSSIGVVSGMDENGKPVSGRTSSRELIVIPGFADNGVGSLSLSLDATRLSLLEEAVKYMFHYPYGCMEQRSAAVLPLVIFGEYLDIFKLNSEVADPRAAVETELKRWVNVQLPGGGFPYWPSGTRADLYVSIRIAHILALAKIKGYNVPAALKIDDLGKYIEQNLYRFNQGDDSYYYVSYLDSYGMYVLSLLGRSVDPARLAELLARDNVDASVLSFTGLSYLHLGRKSDAQKTAERLRNLMRLTARGVDITDPMDRYRYRYYGGSIEQLALSLEFFSQLYPGDTINTRLLHSLLESKRSATYWESTAVTVRVLSAVDALIRSENLASTDLEASSRIGGAELLSGAFKGLAALPKSGSFDFRTSPLNSLQRDALIPLEFERRGSGNLYYSASLSYALPPELQSFRDEGLGVFMSIRNLEGEEINGTALESGKTYRARVRLSSSRDRNYVALRIPVPSGAEILDPGMVSTPRYEELNDSERGLEGRRGAWLSNKVILDNEIQYFWDSFAKGESTVEFLFRTPRRGVYPTPPVQAECMYEGEIFGRSQGLLYTIE